MLAGMIEINDLNGASRRKMAAAEKARWAEIKKVEPSQSKASEISKPKRKFSAASRRKMAAAQKASYAKLKQGSERSKPSGK
jgi:hypothetical protein